MTAPTKVVVLELDGDYRSESVRVRLELGIEGERPLVHSKGTLPPNLALSDALQHWQDRYRNLGQASRAIKPEAILYEGGIRPAAVDDCRNSAQILADQFKTWLSAPAFRALADTLRENLNRQDRIQVSIQTQNRELQRLPWHLWPLIDRYPQAEVGLSAPIAERPVRSPITQKGRTVRILAILGHSKGIDIDTDQRLLKTIPDATIKFLAQPDRPTFSQQLWDEPWDVLFFAGHSETELAQGRIYLNPKDSLTLDELKQSLRKAIQKGLQLAIFNSCDGMGLAYELEQLNIPHMIVMREPVPDPVAQAFLRGFLQAFSQGQSLYEAVREARERLEGVEGDFPCASWLPMIYQNPTASALYWQSLKGQGMPWGFDALQAKFPQLTSKLAAWKSPLFAIAVGLAVSLLIILIKMTGILQPWELQIYDHLMRSRLASPSLTERIAVIAIDEGDIDYQKELNIQGAGSLSDEALALLLERIEPYDPAVIGFDIIHEEPLPSELELGSQNFIAICRRDVPTSDLPAVLPPQKLPQEQLGFSNLPLDPDGVVRRQLLGMTPDESCPTDQSLSFTIALAYLNHFYEGNLEMRREGDTLYLQETAFQKLPANAGGYRLGPNDADGYQVLINFSPEPPIILTFRELLTLREERLKGFIKDKIVLIGVDIKNKDRHVTPYVSDFTRKTPGVIVHAHMVNTILGAVIDGEGLIQWWPEPMENLWIVLWALVGTTIVKLFRNRLAALAIVILLVSQYLICLYSLSVGYWIPLLPSITALVAALGVMAFLAHSKIN